MSTDDLIISVKEMRANFAAVMKLVIDGKRIYITRREKAVAVLEPIQDNKKEDDEKQTKVG